MPSVITPCGGGFSGPACIVRNSANQAFTSGVFAQLAFDTELYDPDNMHSNTVNNSRITFPTAGRYAFFSSVIWFQNNTGIRVCQIIINGAAGIAWQSANAVSTAAVNETTRQNPSGMFDFAAGDYIEIQAKQTSGGSLDSVAVTVPSGYAPLFAAVRVE